MIPNASKCAVCQSQEHNCRDCPSLYSPLTPGFYSGGGGGGGHNHEEEEDDGFRPTHSVGLEEENITKNMFSFLLFTFTSQKSTIMTCKTHYSNHIHAYTSPRTFGKNDKALNFETFQIQNLP